MNTEEEIKKNIYSLFSSVASSIGYSPLHGEIIGLLLISDRTLSLQEIADELGYSLSMISLSLDLLEVLGVIKKVKKSGDRKLYVNLSGDLLEILKKAILFKLQTNIKDSLAGFEKSKQDVQKLRTPEKKQLEKSVQILEDNIKRLERYVKLLSEIRLP
ncbi:MAG: hypothetical protein ABIH52_00585 [Candidatus Aenigmatarchaeota archaeon]